MTSLKHKLARKGFTLIEVVLALGVFFISILSLIGLLAPMLKSVDEVEKIDEITSVVNTVNAYLQGSPEIADDDKTKFDTIYEAVASEYHATLFVFRQYTSDEGTDIRLEIGFLDETSDTIDSFNNIAGPIYRVVLSASSVTPDDSLTEPTRNSATGVYQLASADPAVYPEGYLAMEARIYAEDWNEAFNPSNLPPHGPNAVSFNLQNLLSFEPDFTFNTAIVR